MTGQVKPCPFRKEHEWEPESISTPRMLCRHCYAYKPEEADSEITVPLESLPAPSFSFTTITRPSFWAPAVVPGTGMTLQQQLDQAVKDAFDKLSKGTP